MIRIAAIEISHWHAFHAPAYVRQLRKMDDVQLVGLQDPDIELATRRAAEVGSPPVYSDYREMLSEQKPDFVLALGRHNVMAEIANYVLDQGLPFIMEKPMGVNATEVRSIMETAKRKNGFAAVTMLSRFSPFLSVAQDLIAQGKFGEISHIYLRMNRETSDRYPAWDSPWMLKRDIAGGGALRNFGVHGFDLFLQLVGESAEVTGAQFSNRALKQEVEDYASVQLRSKSGILGTLEVGNLYPLLTPANVPKGLFSGGDAEWKISGSDGMLVFKDGSLIFTDKNAVTVTPVPATPVHPAYMALEEALTAWQKGEKPPKSVEDCYEAAQLIDASYALAKL